MRSYASVPLTSSLPPLSLLEEILYDLPPLEGIMLHWHTHGVVALTPGIVSLFARRKQLLGPATLPGASIQLLATCAEVCLPRGAEESWINTWEVRPLHTQLVRHRHSHSAAETQTLLPPGVHCLILLLPLFLQWAWLTGVSRGWAKTGLILLNLPTLRCEV